MLFSKQQHLLVLTGMHMSQERIARAGEDPKTAKLGEDPSSSEAQVVRLLQASSRNRERIDTLQEEFDLLDKQREPLEASYGQLMVQVELSRHKQASFQSAVDWSLRFPSVFRARCILGFAPSCFVCFKVC